MPGAVAEGDAVEVAVIGGGIVGLVVASGLIRQGVRVKVYEQARGFREIGAGIAFTANTIRCMALIDPEIVTALRSSGSVATSSGGEDDPNDWLRWIDGYSQPREDDPFSQNMLYKIDAGYKGFEGSRRDQFLEALVKVLPPDAIECRRRLDTIQEVEGDRLLLSFYDGSTAEVDAVIGCDGIKSRVRRILLGENHPAVRPQYTHKVAYRGLIPMEKAIQAVGEYKATNQHNHVGPGAHLIHYPVAAKTVVNATVFLSDPGEWADDNQMVLPGQRQDIEEAFADWNPTVRALASLFPEKVERWAVFDLFEYPAPFYSRGNICLAGDAAHASSPHHGAGACMGVEDALCLFRLMGHVMESTKHGVTSKAGALRIAFETFDKVRRTRTQWLVNSSRRVCDLYHQPEWGDPDRKVKAETCFEEIKDRSYKIWHFDYDAMLSESTGIYKEKEQAMSKCTEGS